MIDKLTKRLSHSIRGLNEVKTDEAGRKLIREAIKDMREVWKAQEAYIATIEEANMHLNLTLTHNEALAVEHRLMHDALLASVAIEELETEINVR